MFGLDLGSLSLGNLASNFVPVVIPSNDYDLTTEARAPIESEAGTPIRTERP
jgi:hypothetical protein